MCGSVEKPEVTRVIPSPHMMVSWSEVPASCLRYFFRRSALVIEFDDIRDAFTGVVGQIETESNTVVSRENSMSFSAQKYVCMPSLM